jgi:hypothetical protein
MDVLDAVPTYLPLETRQIRGPRSLTSQSPGITKAKISCSVAMNPMERKPNCNIKFLMLRSHHHHVVHVLKLRIFGINPTREF